MSTTRPPACSQTTAKAENKKCLPRGNLPCGGFCKLTVNWFEWSVCIANMKRQLRCHEVLADARMKQSAWQTFGVMPSSFIWRRHTSFFMHRRCASLKKAARRLSVYVKTLLVNEVFAVQIRSGSFAAVKHSLTLVWSDAHCGLSA